MKRTKRTKPEPRKKPTHDPTKPVREALDAIDGLAADASKRLLGWLGANAFQYVYEGDGLEELREVLKTIDALVCIRNEAATGLKAVQS